MLILAYILIFLLVTVFVSNLVIIFRKQRSYSDYSYNDDVSLYNNLVIDYNNLVDDINEIKSYVKDLEFENSELEEEVEQLLKLIPNGDTNEASDK